MIYYHHIRQNIIGEIFVVRIEINFHWKIFGLYFQKSLPKIKKSYNNTALQLHNIDQNNTSTSGLYTLTYKK